MSGSEKQKGKGKIIEFDFSNMKRSSGSESARNGARIRMMWEAVESVLRSFRFGNRPLGKELAEGARLRIASQSLELYESSLAIRFYGFGGRTPNLYELSNLFEEYVVLFSSLGKGKEYSVLSRLEELDSLEPTGEEMSELLKNIALEILSRKEMVSWNCFCKLLRSCEIPADYLAASVLVRYHVEKSKNNLTFVSSACFQRIWLSSESASNFMASVLRYCDFKTVAELPQKIMDVLTRLELFYRNYKRVEEIF